MKAINKKLVKNKKKSIYYIINIFVYPYPSFTLIYHYGMHMPYKDENTENIGRHYLWLFRLKDTLIFSVFNIWCLLSVLYKCKVGVNAR